MIKVILFKVIVEQYHHRWFSNMANVMNDEVALEQILASVDDILHRHTFLKHFIPCFLKVSWVNICVHDLF